MPFKLDVKKKLVARSARVKSTDIHPSEPWVLVSLYDGKVHLWNYETPQLIKSFEVSDSAIRTAKFIAKNNWIVCGTDTFQIIVYNYNTSERIHLISAHSDYVRSIVVHPTQPYILSSSDDMTIKLWNFNKEFANIQTFEGHQHYVMQIAINPKDSNTFASASLDRTIKVWQLGSAESNFTLEGHERGVNCIDYYHGGEKPYLISGADDKTVKIWDYQTKTCVATLEGHNANISSVLFHPDLPIILTAAEDDSVRVWNMNTYRLEQTYNYGMERVWSLACLKSSNIVSVGYDNGLIVLKLGREEPPISMDCNGKIVWAKYNELQQANVKTVGDKENLKDGAVLPLQVKDMVTCEIYPQSISHNSNGKFVVVCGDGQYIIHTGLTLRNKDFGNALEFAWGNDPKIYAIRDGWVKIFKDSKLYKQFKPDYGCEGIFGGNMLGVKTVAGLAFYDWEELELIRRVEVDAKNVFWSDNDLLCITTDESFFILKYFHDIVAKSKEIENDENLTEDGYEQAFEVISDISESVKSGKWVADTFIYTNADDKLKYYLGGQIVTIAQLERTAYLLGYLPKENRIYLADKELNCISYGLHQTVLNYLSAISSGDLITAEAMAASVPESAKAQVAHFVEKQGYKEIAFEQTNDPGHKFDLAVALGKLDVAEKLADVEESNEKRKQVADLALSESNFDLAIQCMRKTNDFTGLLALGVALDNKKILEEVSSMCLDVPNMKFLTDLIFGRAELAR